MTPVYPSIKISADFDHSGNFATNISAFVVSAISGGNGIFSNRDVERTSSTGSISFDVRIDNVVYTDATVWTGVPIKIEVIYNNTPKMVFKGTIKSAKADSGPYGQHEVHVTITDWFEVSHGTKLKDIPLTTSLRADQAIPLLLNLVPNPPDNVDFETGAETFPYMFDGGTKDTVVYSELDRIVKSELGYLYLTFRSGETLKLENYLSRSSQTSLSVFPKNVSTPSLLKYHGPAGASGYLKYHGPSSTSGRLKIHETSTAALTQIYDSEWTDGENVINEFTTTRVPRNIDVSEVVLYNLDSGIAIGTSQRIIIDGSYSDPNGGTILSAFDIVVPVATTHYKFSEEPKGAGADLTANLIVTFRYGSNGFHVEFYNFSAPGYLWFFQVKGKAMYKYNPVDYIASNIESQENIVRVVKSDSIMREYSNDYNTSKVFSDGVVALNRFPRKEMKSVTFIANYSEALLMAFMYLEQGDKVQITDIDPDHTGNYYIQGIKFTITQGGIITYTWFLKEAVETIGQPISVVNATDVAGSRTAIDFGILPYLSNLQQFSYSMWINRTGTNPYSALIGHSVDTGSGRRGCEYFINGRDIEFYSYKTPNDGHWKVVLGMPNDTNTWHHVVMTYNNMADTEDPMFWVDGVLKTTTEVAAPTGTTDNDSDCPLVLFNLMPNPALPDSKYYIDYSHDAKIKDVRIYNHVLSAAEVAELYAGQNNYSTVQDGLLFNGILVPSDNINDYLDNTIENDDLVFERIRGAAGIPYNGDTSNSNKMLYGKNL